MGGKPFIQYVLARRLYSLEVIGVTSKAHRQFYGRALDTDEVTRVAARNVVYEFPEGTTREFAASSMERANAARAAWAERVRGAEETLRDMRKYQDLAVLDAAKGLGR